MKWRHTVTNPRIFYIKTKRGIEIKIPINNKVTIITGDSATGKTKMIRYISDILKDKSEITETTVILESVVVCKDIEDVKALVDQKEKGKIIFIDRYDSIENISPLISFIRETRNLFILLAHKDVPQCGYDYTSILNMYHNGRQYVAQRLFKTPSDYITNKDILI